jgi:predicted metal-binding membrane protein
MAGRTGVAVTLSAVCGASAVATVGGAGMSMSALEMTRMARPPGLSALGLGNGMMGMAAPAWTPGYAAAMFAMWWIMMLAMMLPSLAPPALRFASVRSNRNRPPASQYAPYLYLAGACLAWGAFSLSATLLHFALDGTGLLTPMMLTTSRWFAALLLLGAGAWQLTHLKDRHLGACRSPRSAIRARRRSDPLRAGLAYGACCVACCWPLMLLLFYGGVMNLWWIAGLAALVFAEQMLPAAAWIRRGIGAVLMIWGAAVAAGVV